MNGLEKSKKFWDAVLGALGIDIDVAGDKSASDSWFDQAYFQRYYFDEKTGVADPTHAARMCASLVFFEGNSIHTPTVLGDGSPICLVKNIPHCAYMHFERNARFGRT